MLNCPQYNLKKDKTNIVLAITDLILQCKTLASAFNRNILLMKISSTKSAFDI